MNAQQNILYLTRIWKKHLKWSLAFHGYLNNHQSYIKKLAGYYVGHKKIDLKKTKIFLKEKSYFHMKHVQKHVSKIVFYKGNPPENFEFFGKNIVANFLSKNIHFVKMS